MRARAVKDRGAVEAEIQGYLDDLKRRHYSPATVGIYGSALADFAVFLAGTGIRRVQDVEREHLERYRSVLVNRGLSPSSIAAFLRAVRQFFNRLERGRSILVNPAAGMEPVRHARRLMPVPSEKDVRILLGHPDTNTPTGLRDRALLEVAYGTGARLLELVRMKLKDVDLEEGTARLFGKGSRERMVPLGLEALRWLKAYVAGARKRLLNGRSSQSLWVSRLGKAMEYEAVRAMCRTHASAAGIRTRITPHALRRACATHMLRRGAHPVEIQTLLGHSSLAMLSQYLKVGIKDMKQMHEQSRLGG